MTSYSTYSDLYLVSLLQTSDQAAFTELYGRYWKPLLLKANYLLRSNQDAEDAVHELFLTIWNKRTELQLQNSFATYISAALKYNCLKKIAGARSSKLINTDLRDDAVESAVADDTTRQWLDFQQLQAELSTALNDLPEKCRIIFMMSREQGLTDKQIAAHLDLSTATVRTQKHRALTKLRLSLGQFFNFLF